MSPAPPLRLLFAVALLSAAVLAFEVALTRVFAALLRYHFAFLVISIALCGLGLGGYGAYWWRRVRSVSLAASAAVFAAGAVLALVLMLRGIFAYMPQAFWLAALVVLIPFIGAGLFLAEAFARHSAWSSRLYAWDLAGAALAALGTVHLLHRLSAIDVCLVAALLGGLVVLLVAPGQRRAGWWSVPVVIALLLAINPRWRWLDVPAIPPQADASGTSLADRGVTQPLYTELGTPGHTSRIVDTRWNAFARTDVVADTAMPHTYYIYTNGNVPTNMMRWNGQMGSIGPLVGMFTLSDWTFAVAPLGVPPTGATPYPRGTVLSIGPGGGLDALLGLHHGAAKFEGAEINPSIVQLMHDYRDFNGKLYEHPRVQVATAEGRAYVRQAAAAGSRYALVFSALTKTATAGQGMALLESFVYTTDAFEDYLRALEPGGQVTVVLDDPRLLARFFATALQVLKKRGLDEVAACRQMALVADPQANSPYVFALVVQNRPFTRAQNVFMEEEARRRNLQPLWISGQAESAEAGPYPAVGNGKMSLEQFIAGYRTEAGLDVSPCPDNRPFVLDLYLFILPVFKQLTVLALVLALGLAAAGWHWRESRAWSPHDLRGIGYFLALGLGFMLVEIPLIQLLILSLGYPTLALTTIIFSILLGGGAGAWFSQKVPVERLTIMAAVCAGGVALCSLLLAAAGPPLQDALLPLPLWQRSLCIGLLLLPLGCLMGIPFPAGMRVMAARQPSLIPLIWGLNGVASVVGSLLAAMAGRNYGFTAALTCGAAIYVVAGLLIGTMPRLEGTMAAGKMKHSPADGVPIEDSEVSSL